MKSYGTVESNHEVRFENLITLMLRKLEIVCCDRTWKIELNGPKISKTKNISLRLGFGKVDSIGKY